MLKKMREAKIFNGQKDIVNVFPYTRDYIVMYYVECFA